MNIHNEKKIAIEDMKKNIYLQGVASNNDLIFYIKKSINYLDYNEKNEVGFVICFKKFKIVIESFIFNSLANPS